MTMEIQANIGRLDVIKGRGPLIKRLKGRPVVGECPENQRTPITITGYISDVFSGFDGISQEFEFVIQTLVVGKVD